jgi:2-polyprenyl-3-methyl-5-hydroxy-6-metoxy-1,4-benzoquinol methylase
MDDKISTMLKTIYLYLIKVYGDKEQKFLNFISTYLKHCKNVLDIGCGPSPYLTRLHKYNFVCGIDAHFKVCSELQKKNIYNLVVNANILSIPVKNNSFDAVVIFQVIEHLTKEDGYKFIRQVEGIANKIIVITTPNGFLVQEPYNGNPFQEHKSGWIIDDLQNLGYSVFGLEGLKCLYRKGTSKLIFPSIFWGKLINLGIFEKFVRNKPKLAFQLIAIKII